MRQCSNNTATGTATPLTGGGRRAQAPDNTRNPQTSPSARKVTGGSLKNKSIYFCE